MTTDRDFTVVDVETTGDHPWLADLVAVGIGEQVHRPEEGMAAAADLLAGDGVIVCHTNYDLRWLILNGAPMGPNFAYHDTAVMAFMLDMSQERDLASLAAKYLGFEDVRKPIKRVQGRIMFERSVWLGHEVEPDLVPIEDVPWDEMVAYNGQDLKVTADLYEALRAELQHNGDWEKFFLAEEARLSRLLIEMEVTGLPIDIEATKAMLASADAERQRLVESLCEATGIYGFNLKSTDQVAAYLYDELPTFKVQIEVPGLKALKKDEREAAIQGMIPAGVHVTKIGTKYVYGWQVTDGLGIPPPKMNLRVSKGTGTSDKHKKKRPPTDAGNLVLLNSVYQLPWISDYLRWRQLQTLCANYLEKWIEAEHNGRLHGRFSQSVETGRIASRDPNLMAIPTTMDFNVREQFCLPPPGMMIGDYNGMDIRVAAHFSQDPVMLEIFRNDQDMYGSIAAQMWGGPADKTHPNRNLMKVLMLSAQYGAAAGSIGDKIRISSLGEEHARRAPQLLKELEETLPRLFEWRLEIEAQARIDGYISTISGRKRPLPELYHEDKWRRMTAERQCVASMVQGSSADIVRASMLAVRDAVDPDAARFLLQVHDEILFAIGPAWTDDTFGQIEQICSYGHGYELNVPMKFSAGIGLSWADKDGQGGASYRRRS